MSRIFALIIVVTAAMTLGSPLLAQTDTTFTYQGELKENGSPANGPFDIEFNLFGAMSGGSPIAPAVVLVGVPVVDGKFTVNLGFGAAAFDNSDRWLEIEVNGIPLSPRSPITRAPYAIQTRGIFGSPSGNVGIGTSTPFAKLDVVNDTEFVGVQAVSSLGAAMTAKSNYQDGTGIIATADTGNLAYGVWGISAQGYAGFFSGDVNVDGTLSKSAGSFKIDHPLDPENKYLSHSFVESPDMMNIYNGNIVTDADGYATVDLPEWFAVLNRDFRYQLTLIDAANSDTFVLAKVVEEIRNNQFRIRTSVPNSKVSWLVTGVRQDPYAEANRIQVEQPKPRELRGLYRHPELYGRTADFREESIKLSADMRQRLKSTKTSDQQIDSPIE